MALKNQIKNLPMKPGVYYFIDEKSTVLYVGKAKNLRNRARQYFLKNLGRGPSIEQMVQLAADIKWIETESEIEAVLLEAEQIRKLKPKYNIRQKDDKSFLVIKITRKITNSKLLISNQILNPKSKISKPNSSNTAIKQCNNEAIFPCVELVRFKNVDLRDKSADYFGPYPSGDLLKMSLRFLRKVFPFRDCSVTKFNTYCRKGRPCTYGDLRVCTGPCAGWVNVEEYERNIKYLKDFLRGKKVKIITSLEKEMKTLSKKKLYEEAANVRNQFRALGHLNDIAVGVRDDLFDASAILFKRIECYDISNLFDKEAVGSMVVFSEGRPNKGQYRKFRIKNPHVISSAPPRRTEGETGVEKSPGRKDLSPSLPSANGGQGMGRDDNREMPASDLARLEQILTRRFAGDWPLPDLIIIDGGNLQLEVAKKVLREYNLNVPAVSISKGPQRDKNDFHFGNSLIAERFKGNTALKNIAISARDESHRFAISYYRKLHQKGIFK